ncbi:phage tail protein [Salinisphaera orenii]|uniref:phage tail protein n=1 Tax=Salinisphaera orenii TaxID=856731 RepID=UPI000DBE21F8
MAGDTNLAVSVLLRARDQLTGSVGKARQVTGRLNDTVRRVGRNPGFAKMRDKIGRTTDAAKRLTRRVAKIGAGVGGAVAAATGALTALTSSFAANATEVQRWADRLGISVEKLSRLQYVGKQFGVQQDALTDGLKELSLRTDEFLNTKSGGPANQAFKRLGLTMDELKAKSDDAGALFKLVASRLHNIDNAAKRQRIADEIFGGQGGEQLVKMASASADELARMGDEADRVGATISGDAAGSARQFTRAWSRVKGVLSGIRNTIAAPLMPVLTNQLGKLSDWLVKSQPQIKAWVKAFADKLPERIKAVREGLHSFIQAAGDLIDKAQPLIGLGERLADRFGGMHVAVAGLAAVLGASILGPVVSLTASIASLGGTLAGLATKALPLVIAGVRTLTAVMIANPIIAIIAAIAGAAFLIYKYWGPISDFFTGLWNDVTGIVSGAYDKIKSWLGFDPLAPIKLVWEGLTRYFANIWADIKAIFSGDIGAIGDLLLDLSPVNILKPAFKAAWNWLSSIDWSAVGTKILKTLVGGITGAASWVGGAVKSAVSAAWQWLANVDWAAVGKKVLMTLAKSLKNTGQYVVDAVKSAVAAAWHWLSNIDWSEVGKKLLGTLVSGLKDAAGAVKDAVARALAKARSYLPFSDAKQGPLSDLTKSGRAVPGTLARGIGQGQPALVGAMRRSLAAANDEISRARPGSPSMPGSRAAKDEITRSGAAPAPRAPSSSTRGASATAALSAPGSRPASAGRGGVHVQRVEFAPQVTIQVGDDAGARDVGDELDRRMAAWKNVDLWSGIQSVAVDN